MKLVESRVGFHSMSQSFADGRLIHERHRGDRSVSRFEGERNGLRLCWNGRPLIHSARFGKSIFVVTLRLLARLRCPDWVRTIDQSSLL